MFLTETHFHTSLSSPCANVPPEEALAAYINCGYSALVVTDHFSRICREHYGIDDNGEWVDRFLSGYRYLKQTMTSMHVLLGMEIRFDENANDYLVFGFSEEDLYQHPTMYEWSIQEFYRYAHERGWLVVQAHPFRDGMTITPPSCVDGIEIFNGNPRHNSRNEMAEHWARLNGLLTTSGSDYHQRKDAARGGLVTESSITTIGELVAAIRSGVGIYRKMVNR